MPRFALHCFPPSRLLRATRHAEEAGFDAGMSSGHLAPWNQRQGECLGAAPTTSSPPFGEHVLPALR